MIKKSTKPNWYFFKKGFIKLFDGLICILSLGFYWSDYEYQYTKKQLK
jgi:hypothetical protein